MSCSNPIGYVSTTTRRIILYDYQNASPRNQADNHGLDLDILGDGYSLFLADHETRSETAAAYGVRLGIAINSPFGRGTGVEELPNGEYTGYFLDALLRAEADGFTDLEADFVANTDPSKTVIYLGSIPVTTFAEAGLSDLIAAGYAFCFDAITTHDADSVMIAQAKELAKTNMVWAEANKEYKGLPLVGFAGLWENPKRVSIAQAPHDSVWWWRTAGNDGDWDIDKAKNALDNGLVLWVRLDQLTADQQTELYQLVATYEGRIADSYCIHTAAIDVIPCCGDDLLNDIIFGPFSAGLDVFVSYTGAGFEGFAQYLGGSGGTSGDAGFGGSGVGIGDGDDGPPTIGGDANSGGPGHDIGDGDGGGGGGQHPGPPVGGGSGGQAGGGVDIE